VNLASCSVSWSAYGLLMEVGGGCGLLQQVQGLAKGSSVVQPCSNGVQGHILPARCRTRHEGRCQHGERRKGKQRGLGHWWLTGGSREGLGEVVLSALHVLARMEFQTEVVVAIAGPHATSCRQGQGSTVKPWAMALATRRAWHRGRELRAEWTTPWGGAGRVRARRGTMW